MARNKKETIYDEDGTLVEVTDGSTSKPPVGPVVPPNIPEFHGKTYQVSDIIDTLAGYMSPSFGFLKGDSKGVCVVCGSETAFQIRKLCGSCMNNYIQQLYEETKEAVGSQTFEIP